MGRPVDVETDAPHGLSTWWLNRLMEQGRTYDQAVAELLERRRHSQARRHRLTAYDPDLNGDTK